MELPGLDKRDKEARYAIRFQTMESLEDLWLQLHGNETCYLRFNDRATDSLSGFSKVFEKTYRSLKAVEEGQFEYGNSFTIVSF
jgi:hypothetical protein